MLIFSISNCQTKIEVQSILIPIPLPPDKPNVIFIDTGEGLFLSYEHARDLSVYFIEVDAYEKELLIILNYYEPTFD